VSLRKSVSAFKYSKEGPLYFVVVVAVPLARHSSTVGESHNLKYR